MENHNSDDLVPVQRLSKIDRPFKIQSTALELDEIAPTYKDLDDEEFTLLHIKETKVGLIIKNFRDALITHLSNYKKQTRLAITLLLVVGYIIYFGFAMSKKYGYYPFPFPNGNYILFILTLIVVLFVLWEKLMPLVNRKFQISENITAVYDKLLGKWKKYIPLAIGCTIFVISVAMVIYFGVKGKNPKNFQSLLGIVLLLGIGYIFSTDPQLVRWRVVGAGFLLQFWLGMFVLRTKFGYDLMDFVGEKVTIFLNFSRDGAAFVYGDTFMDHFFAFAVTSVIIFLSAVVSLLYHFGAMQWVIYKIAWVLTRLIGSSPAESVNSAANIFLGQTEAPILIKPFIVNMTPSEIHAVMVGGFASVSGSVLAGYIAFGVSAQHLITACVMAAPGALAMSKLMYPEKVMTRATADDMRYYKPEKIGSGAVDVALSSATNALKICGSIIASLIAAISILYFLDSIVNWLFSMVHQPQVNFQLLIGYLFWPFAFCLGIDPKDCLTSGRLFGIKTFLNEFIAFQELGKLETLRNELIANKTFPLYLNGTLTLPPGTLMLWTEKAVVVITYALCGFANFSSVGIMIGGLGTIAPNRRNTVTSNVFRALLAAIMANMVTACIAGLLFQEVVS